MGEQTLPEIAQALTDGGHTTRRRSSPASSPSSTRRSRTANTRTAPNTATTTPAKRPSTWRPSRTTNSTVLGKVNAKTRACRGQAAGLVLLRRPGDAERRELVAIPVHRRAGRLLHGRLAAARSRRRPRSTSGCRTPPRSPTSAPSTPGRWTPTPANLGTVAWTYQAHERERLRQQLRPAGRPASCTTAGGRCRGEADLGLFGAIRILSADVAVDPIFGLYRLRLQTSRRRTAATRSRRRTACSSG